MCIRDRVCLGAVEVPLVKDVGTLGTLAHEMGHLQSPYGTGVIDVDDIPKKFQDKDVGIGLMAEFYSDKNVQSLLDRYGLTGTPEGDQIRSGWRRYVSSLEEKGDGLLGFTGKIGEMEGYDVAQYTDDVMEDWLEKEGLDQIKKATKIRNMSLDDLLADVFERGPEKPGDVDGFLSPASKPEWRRQPDGSYVDAKTGKKSVGEFKSNPLSNTARARAKLRGLQPELRNRFVKQQIEQSPSTASLWEEALADIQSRGLKHGGFVWH